MFKAELDVRLEQNLALNARTDAKPAPYPTLFFTEIMQNCPQDGVETQKCFAVLNPAYM
jgi:hypothetical protein